MHIKGKDSILRKIVLEVRYEQGFTYLDKCGRTVNTVMREHPEWVIKGNTPDPSNAGLVSLHNGCLLNFSAFKYDVSLEKPIGGNPLSDSEFSEFVQQVT